MRLLRVCLTLVPHLSCVLPPSSIAHRPAPGSTGKYKEDDGEGDGEEVGAADISAGGSSV